MHTCMKATVYKVALQCIYITGASATVYTIKLHYNAFILQVILQLYSMYLLTCRVHICTILHFIVLKLCAVTVTMVIMSKLESIKVVLEKE